MCQKEIFKSKPPDLRLEIVELVLGVAAANIFSDFLSFIKTCFIFFFCKAGGAHFKIKAPHAHGSFWVSRKYYSVYFLIFCNPTTHQKKQIQPKVTKPFRWRSPRGTAGRQGRLPQRAGDGVVGGPEQKLVEVSWRMELVLRTNVGSAACETVLGTPDPAADRTDSEDSDSEREGKTADRMAERLGLTQFLRRKKGRGRDRRPKAEPAPKGGRGGGRGGAGGAGGCCVDGATERRS